VVNCLLPVQLSRLRCILWLVGNFTVSVYYFYLKSGVSYATITVTIPRSLLFVEYYLSIVCFIKGAEDVKSDIS